MTIVSTYKILKKDVFPSPYGVSFILILKVNEINSFKILKFPSPYGVSFILMSMKKIIHL